MRAFLLLSLLPLHVIAQPGWEELRFSFVLEHNGVEVPVEALRKDFVFEVDGERTRPITMNNSRFSAVRFPAERSDITRHRDTLWLRILHREEEVMEIAFPPRAGMRSNQLYGTENRVVTFAPGRVLVTEFLKELHVTGTMTGIGQLWNAGPVYVPSATCGYDTVRHVTASVGGAMDFRIRCRTLPRPEGACMAEMSFFIHTPYQPELVMNVRGAALGEYWPLDTVRFAPADYKLTAWRHRELDITAARDTVYGWDRSGSVVYLSNAHPTSNDTLHFRFWWLGGGENVRIAHRVAPGFEGVRSLVFTVERSPIDMPGVYFKAREIDVVVPPLPRGTFEMSITYEEDPGTEAPRFPALQGRWLRVR